MLNSSVLGILRDRRTSWFYDNSLLTSGIGENGACGLDFSSQNQ